MGGKIEVEMYKKNFNYEVENIIKYNDSNPITEITFSLGKTLEDCYDGLKRNNYQVIDGDIRESCGGKYGALGVRKFKDYHGDPITNIIGTISKEIQPESFTQDGCTYYKVRDIDGYGDIHRDEGGVYCFLYYTKDSCGKNPIKDLVFATYKTARTNTQEVAQNSYKSLRSYDLDLAAMRGYSYNKCNMRKAKYNYIYIYRI